MNPESANSGGRRILVAVDSNAESLAGLRRAANLAAELQVELAALFLEDINLLRMSELPGQEISLSSGVGRSTSRTDMERQMRRRAAQARQEVERLAQTLSLRWSFEVRRAALDTALREAAQTEELVCSALAPPPLPQTSRRRGQLSETVRGRPRPVLALYEGGPCGRRVLELASRAARAIGQPLEVLVPGRSGSAGERLLADVSRIVAENGVAGTMRRVPTSERALHNALATAHGQLLFLDSAGKAASADRLPALRSAAKCDVLLVSHR